MEAPISKSHADGDVWESIDWSISVLLGAAIGAVLPLAFLHEAITADEVAAITGVFAAVATFSAVWAALMPIRLAEKRRLAAASAVRVTAHNLLYALATQLEVRRLWGWEPRPIFTAPIAKNAMHRLWELLPRTELLDVKEQVAVSRAMNQWEWLAHVEAGGPGQVDVENLLLVLGFVIEAHDTLADALLGEPHFVDNPAIVSLNRDRRGT